MNSTFGGVIGPGFLNQVPTLLCYVQQIGNGVESMSRHLRLRDPEP